MRRAWRYVTSANPWPLVITPLAVVLRMKCRSRRQRSRGRSRNRPGLLTLQFDAARGLRSGHFPSLKICREGLLLLNPRTVTSFGQPAGPFWLQAARAQNHGVVGLSEPSRGSGRTQAEPARQRARRSPSRYNEGLASAVEASASDSSAFLDALGARVSRPLL